MVSIRLPEMTVSVPDELRTAQSGELLGINIASRVVAFGEVITEPRLAGLCPDALVREADGTPLLLEIVVTNDVSPDKYHKLCQLGYPTLSIALSREDAGISPAQLEEKIRDNIACKRWVFHPDEVAARQRIEAALIKLEDEQRHLQEEQRRARREAVEVEYKTSLEDMHEVLREFRGAVPFEKLDTFRMERRSQSRNHQSPTREELRMEALRLYYLGKADIDDERAARRPDIEIEKHRYKKHTGG